MTLSESTPTTVAPYFQYQQTEYNDYSPDSEKIK